ncbi:hypothetical protein SCP_1002400 [Sparassis crispa]|uniref:Uncharacterized protein n=1 Tax=Sparassis crispa TaxID=139825 RepID=A0A401GYH6_9APHY|nr:hypothetical protein SCP_1002400 [Sparassis crispa]GBE86994.1 hypothetical protein SCP_1002400 [Sparassis crispa]
MKVFADPAFWSKTVWCRGVVEQLEHRYLQQENARRARTMRKYDHAFVCVASTPTTVIPPGMDGEQLANAVSHLADYNQLPGERQPASIPLSVIACIPPSTYCYNVVLNHSGA